MSSSHLPFPGDDTNEARPDETSYEAVNGSGDPDLENLTVLDEEDPDLGLTNIGEIGPDDWAADTGPTHTNEEVNPTHNR
jgi:hypothetical protein